MHEDKVTNKSTQSHFDTRFGNAETLQGEGKIGVGMTATMLHYCSNKVGLLGLTIDHF